MVRAVAAGLLTVICIPELVGATVTPLAVELAHTSGARVVFDRKALAPVPRAKGTKR